VWILLKPVSFWSMVILLCVIFFLKLSRIYGRVVKKSIVHYFLWVYCIKCSYYSINFICTIICYKYEELFTRFCNKNLLTVQEFFHICKNYQMLSFHSWLRTSVSAANFAVRYTFHVFLDVFDYFQSRIISKCLFLKVFSCYTRYFVSFLSIIAFYRINIDLHRKY